MVEFINEVAANWSRYFGFSILQNTIFLGIVFLMLAKFKTLPAKIKYIISLTALFKLLIPPFVPIYFKSFVKDDFAGEISAQALQMIDGNVAITPAFSNEGKLFLMWLAVAAIYLFAVAIITIYYHYRIRTSIKNETVSSHYPKIKICETDFVSTPMSLGILPRKIYIPDNWHELPSECYDIMLHHEYAHIKNRDGIIQLFQNFIQAIYFFHPFVWLLNKFINEYREMVCDDFAIEGSQLAPVKFSRYLVQIAETITLNRWNSISASALIKQKNLLLNRINYQVKEQSMKNYSKMKAGLLVLALLMLMVPLSLYSKAIIANESPNLAAAATTKVWGKVVDIETGEPISGVIVELQGSGRKKVKTDDKGMYYIIGVDEGEFKALYAKEGYKKVLLNCVTVGKQSFELNAKLMKGKKLSEMDAPPPPPPADSDNFQDYDQAPSIIGGYKELASYVKYPPDAHKKGIEGTVYLKVLVGKDGNAKQVDVIKSLAPDCDDAAKKAAMIVKYRPAIKDGEKKEVWISIPVKFKLG